MNIKIDFPYPPKHYKLITKDNWQDSPNLNLFFEKTNQIVLFGQNENLKNKEIKNLPNYLQNQKVQYFKNTSFKKDLIIMIDELQNTFKEYLLALNNQSESLRDLQEKMTDILKQIFYILKIAKNKLESVSQLNQVLKRDLKNYQDIIESYKGLLGELNQKID